MSSNILLQPFKTPYGAVPFQEIQITDFEPAITHLIEEAKKEIAGIVANDAPPSFENTIEALERCGSQLQIATSVFYNLNSADTNDEMEQLAQKLSPILAAYSNDILLNEALYQKVAAVFNHQDATSLSQEQQRLLEKTYKAFVRNGASLSDDKKTTLRNLDQEQAMLGVQYAQNVLAETNAYFLHLEKEEDVAGLPPSALALGKEEAEKRGLNGWVYTLQFPSLTAFLKYSSRRDLRQQLHKASGMRAMQDNKHNNEQIIKQITSLRQSRAELLGFKDHADFVLEERMAGNKEAVLAFLENMLDKAKPKAIKELEALQALATKDNIQAIQAYDHAYYAEKLKEQTFDFSEEALKPYFPLEQSLKAAFLVAEKLYGLTFEKIDTVPVYHPEVAVYDVLENGKHKALLYTDFFPRAGKRPGAWMTSFKGQYIHEGENHRPHISIVCNFSKPIGDTPSLLNFTEFTTLFHEFGHALHGILANTCYESLSGTNVYWDFVELPSQFMENYCYEKSFLQTIAMHYQTGEVLDDITIDKLVASANFMQGYQTLRQIGFAMLDMHYHSGIPITESIEQFEKKAIAATSLYPNITGVAISPTFSHIFAGGYAAGYYSYKWAEVLDADAFAFFKEHGIFNPEIATKFKNLLSAGGTIDPMQLYIAFRGQKPSVDTLLKRAGIL